MIRKYKENLTDRKLVKSKFCGHLHWNEWVDCSLQFEGYIKIKDGKIYEIKL